MQSDYKNPFTLIIKVKNYFLVHIQQKGSLTEEDQAVEARLNLIRDNIFLN